MLILTGKEDRCLPILSPRQLTFPLQRGLLEIRLQPTEEWVPGQGELVCSRIPCCVAYSRLGNISENPLLIIAMSCQSWHTAKETKTQRGAG